MAKKVLSGLVTAWRLAGWPTRRSPSSVKATIEGVVRAPSAFSMTLGGAFHDRDARIGRAEVDADDFSHDYSFLRRDRRTPKRSGLEDAAFRSRDPPRPVPYLTAMRLCAARPAARAEPAYRRRVFSTQAGPGG